MDNKLIIALDVETVKEARHLVSILGAQAGMLKIGSQLFTAAGPEFVREIVRAGGRVFLDLKFHDIPNTVAAASREAVRLGVSLFNVHAAGGGEMMRRAAEAANETAERENLPRPKLIAVTVLTSANADVLAEVGVSGALENKSQGWRCWRPQADSTVWWHRPTRSRRCAQSSRAIIFCS
jgi:orotidine-5'-phosphate decarboxylase